MRYSDYVDYGKLDPFKAMALKNLSATFGGPRRLGIRVVLESLGEPASLFDFIGYDFMLAFVIEGLGTKNLIAEKMAIHESASGKKFYRGLGQDLLATAVNELPCVGATPFGYGDEVAVGDSEWFDDSVRSEQLLEGLTEACTKAMVATPCGETPTLQDIVLRDGVSLSGGAMGIVRPKSRAMWGQSLRGGDVIYGIGSNGIHANGITLARRIIEGLPDGYFTSLTNSETIGESLLRPTHIYSPLIEALWEEGVEIHYISNITGHGWRKIMRPKKAFTYDITFVPEPPPELLYLQRNGRISDEEAYQVWNMGVGYCLYSPAEYGDAITSAAGKMSLRCYALGRVTEGARGVIIRPKGIVYR